MAISLKHLFVSAKTDSPDSTRVQPSNWNAAHTLTMANGKVLGKVVGADGAVEELPLVVDATGQSLIPPVGTTAQRPASPVAGMIRYNSSLAALEAYISGVWGPIGAVLNAALTSISGLTTAANKMIYTTAANTYAVTDLTAAGRAILDDADATAQRTTLGLAIGTDVQAYNAALASLAGLSLVAGDVLYATGANTLVRLAKGTGRQALVMNNGATAPEWFGGEAGPTTASGTAVNFSSIPANARRIVVFFDGVSMSGTDIAMIQLGTSGAAETTGYAAVVSRVDAGTTGASQVTNGFQINLANAANAASGMVILEKEPGSNSWHCNASVNNASSGSAFAAGRKPLAGVLDFLRVVATGANTFDAGTISIRWNA